MPRGSRIDPLPSALAALKSPTVSGTIIVSADAPTFTSALCPQDSHVAITKRTPFLRMFARVMSDSNGAFTQTIPQLPQARSNLASNPVHTDSPRNATRSLSWRVSPDRLKLAEPVRKRR